METSVRARRFHLVWMTASTHFPATNPIQAALRGTTDALALRMNSTGSEIAIPVASLKQAGSGDSASCTYSKKLGEVSGLKKCQFSNKKKWIIANDEISGTGTPATGSGLSAFDLRKAIDVPTATGTQSFITTVEIKRPAGSSKNWSH